MNERTFKLEIAKAKILKKRKDNPEYWRGYERGLKRRFYGKRFGTMEEHRKWLLADSSKPQRERSKGYRDGLWGT